MHLSLQIELAILRFPYDSWGTPFQLKQVVECRRSCPQTSSPKSLLTLPTVVRQPVSQKPGRWREGALLTSSIGPIHVPTSTPSVDGVISLLLSNNYGSAWSPLSSEPQRGVSCSVILAQVQRDGHWVFGGNSEERP